MTRSTIQLQMGPRQWLMLLSLSMLWGGSFFFVDIAVMELSPLWTVTLRVIAATLVLAGYLLLSGRSLRLTPKLFAAFLLMGFLSNALPFTLIAWGQMSIASGLASMLNAATPIFTMIVAGLLLADERFTYQRVFGALIGAAGVATMIGPSALSFGTAALLPQLAVLAATVSYAFGTVFGRRFTSMGLDPVVIALGQLLGSSVLLLPVALGVEGPQALSALSLQTALAIGALGVVSTAIAYLLFFRLLAEAGATNTVLVTLLVPVSATLLGISLLDETVTAYQLAGISIIALGLSLIDGRLWQRRLPSAS